MKERARAPKVHPNTQLAASVQQLYDLLSADRRASTPQHPSSLSNNSPLPNNSNTNNSPPLPRTRPVTSSSPLSSIENPPTYSHQQHYDHLIDPERNNNSNNNNLTPVPPKTSKSSRTHKRSKSREPKDKLFVAGKSFTP